MHQHFELILNYNNIGIQRAIISRLTVIHSIIKLTSPVSQKYHRLTVLCITRRAFSLDRNDPQLGGGIGRRASEVARISNPLSQRSPTSLSRSARSSGSFIPSRKRIAGRSWFRLCSFFLRVPVPRGTPGMRPVPCHTEILFLEI